MSWAKQGTASTADFFLRQLENLMLCSHAGINSILTFGITVWYGNTSEQDRKRLDRMVCTPSEVIGQELLSPAAIYTITLQKKGLPHRANHNFNLLLLKDCKVSEPGQPGNPEDVPTLNS